MTEGYLLEVEGRDGIPRSADAEAALVKATQAIDRARQREVPLPYCLIGDEDGAVPVWALIAIACLLEEAGRELFEATGDSSIRDLAGAVHVWTFVRVDNQGGPR